MRRAGKSDINEWTDDEWANDIADEYANRAWTTIPHIHCSNIAIPFLHHTSLQIQVPGGSMSGKIARRLADDINRRRGLQQLPKILRLEDDLFGTIDWQSFGTASTTFTKTVFSQAHFCKQVSSHWYTEARAHKFEPLASDRCRCCKWDVAETMDHILQCPSREPIHNFFFTKFTELMRDKEIPNDIGQMFEAGIDKILI